MKNLKNTKTWKNLMEAFAGESQAYTKYLYFASKAKKEGYVQIANFFTETALNEKEHAKIWFKLLNGGSINTTKQNLKAAAIGENFEWTKMYKRMANEAIKEGFPQIAALFKGVAKIEADHEKRYRSLLNDINNDHVFTSNKDEEWVCLNCGNRIKSKKAPKLCPVCNHPQSYYKQLKKYY